jgi:hypothetical protein
MEEGNLALQDSLSDCGGDIDRYLAKLAERYVLPLIGSAIPQNSVSKNNLKFHSAFNPSICITISPFLGMRQDL